MKKFTVDFLTKKSKINEGEVPQYYVENSHESIIAPEEWDAVQDEKEERRRKSRAIKRCISDLSKRDELITEFDDCLWLTIVDSVVVNKDGGLTFRFFSGIEVEG